MLIFDVFVNFDTFSLCDEKVLKVGAEFKDQKMGFHILKHITREKTRLKRKLKLRRFEIDSNFS